MKRAFGWGPIIIFFFIAIGVATISYFMGTIMSKRGVAKRYLYEASLISESDRVETYVRSFQRACDLSLIQSVYDSGKEYILLPYDFDDDPPDAEYSQKYNMAYWRIYDEMYIPPLPIMKNKVKQEISWISSNYVDGYQEVFKDFSESSKSGISISGPTRVRVTDLSENGIIIQGEANYFSYITKVEDQDIDIEREYIPNSELNIKLEKMIEIANNIVYGNDIVDAVINNDNRGDANTALKNLAESLIEGEIKVILEIPEDDDFKTSGDDVRAVIKVSIYDDTIDYPLYSFLNDPDNPDDDVELGFLGVNFLVKVGDLVEATDPDIKKAWELNDWDECDSRLGIISTKDVCGFFSLTPTTCSGTYNIYSSGTCTDFTGSYEDLCVDSDTLYEYDCHSSNICYYRSVYCSLGCVNGRCIPPSVPTTTTTTTTIEVKCPEGVPICWLPCTSSNVGQVEDGYCCKKIDETTYEWDLC